MIYIAYFILFFTAIQFMVALANVLFEPKLPRQKIKSSELVSVLIPARNEAENIGTLLNDLQMQYHINIEVIVFNDQSIDRTASVVEEFVKQDNRIRILHSTGLPDGWLGKNYACHSLAQQAHGKYFLFLDADVRVGGALISDAIAYAQKHALKLLTIFPKQIIKTAGEKMTVPNMNYILLSLLPLVLVRTSKNYSFAAANGQFMFFDADTYKATRPHEQMKLNKVEDIAISQWYKKQQIRIACLVGNDFIRCRMYTGFKDAVNGFSKNVTAFFGNSFFLAILFWLTTTFGWWFVLQTLSVQIFIAYIIAYILTRIMISKVSQQKILDNILYLIPQQIACGLFIYKALMNRLKKDYTWKGRNVQ